MRAEIAEAIESARSTMIKTDGFLGRAKRRHSFDMVRALTLSVIRELPESMTLAELRDELELEAHEFSNGGR